MGCRLAGNVDRAHQPIVEGRFPLFNEPRHLTVVRMAEKRQKTPHQPGNGQEGGGQPDERQCRRRTRGPARREHGEAEDQRDRERRAHERMQQPHTAPTAANSSQQIANLAVMAHAVLAAIRPSTVSVITISAIAYCHRCCVSSCCRASKRAAGRSASFMCVIAA